MTITVSTKMQSLIYTSPQGLNMEMLVILDTEKRGYINATAIAKQFGKVPKDWIRSVSIQAYIKALIEKLNHRQEICFSGETKPVTYGELVVAVNGGPIINHGTWLHPKLAVVFARWLTPHFAVWCDDQLESIMQQTTSHSNTSLVPSIKSKELQVLEQRLLKRMTDRLAQQEQYILEQVNLHLAATADMLNQLHSQFVAGMSQSLGRIHSDTNSEQNSLHDATLLPKLSATTPPSTPTSATNAFENHDQQQYAELPVIDVTQEAKALRAAGKSWQAIAASFNKRDIPTISGSGKWHGSTVKRCYFK